MTAPSHHTANQKRAARMPAKCTTCGADAVARELCNTHYAAHRRRMTAYGKWQPLIIPAEDARTHIAALRGRGIGWRRLAQLTGINKQSLFSLGTSHGPVTAARKTVEQVLAIPLPEIYEIRHYVADAAFIPAIGSTRRVQALMAIGHTAYSLAHHLNLKDNRDITGVLSGRQQHITATRARSIAELFDRLQLTPGPSVRARAHATKHGWAPPLAWDEETIDDPQAQPDTEPSAIVTSLERYQELKDIGVPDSRIPERLGIRARSLARQLMRLGIPVSPTIASMAAAERFAQAAS